MTKPLFGYPWINHIHDVHAQYQSQINKYMTGFQKTFIDIEQIKEQMASLADTSYQECYIFLIICCFRTYLVTFLFFAVQYYD